MPGAWALHQGPAEEAYPQWETPDLIVSDGAYGLGGFPGDPTDSSRLPEWYREHVKCWSPASRPGTTLWFWNSEIGWARLHPLLEEHGWVYVQTIVWDKGIGHIAGRCHGGTSRQLPVVTEVCAFYRRPPTVRTAGGTMHARDWLGTEWRRTGLSLKEANAACGVRDAASRKYLTGDRHWYAPDGRTLERLAEYANARGDPDGRPYFRPDGCRPMTADEWERLRHPWRHRHGLTNVWTHKPISRSERLQADRQGSGPVRPLHPNQKPLELMERILELGTRIGDTVWEPFGGLCTASAAAVRAGRKARAAEPDERYWGPARRRLEEAAAAVTGSRA